MSDFSFRKADDGWAVVVGDDEQVVGHVFWTEGALSNLGRGLGGTKGSSVLSRNFNRGRGKLWAASVDRVDFLTDNERRAITDHLDRRKTSRAFAATMLLMADEEAGVIRRDA